MKKLIFVLIFCIILGSLPTVLADDAAVITEEAIIHVSTSGDDANSGKEESPLATLEGAKLLIKKMNRHKPITVLIHGGEYPVAKTIQFTSTDAGTLRSPITYKAAGDGEVIFNGAFSLDLSGFKKITDENILKRLPKSAVGRVGQLDLNAQGITRDHLIMTDEQGRSPESEFIKVVPLNFYLNGREQTLARWPNSGFELINKVVSSHTFEYTQPNPTNWTKAKDAYIAGYLYLEYFGGWSRLSSVDTEKRTITVGTGEGVKTNHRWMAINLIEELDIPGEWYVDKSSMILYYYPEKLLDPKKDRMELPILRQPFISLTGCPYLTFDGLTFTKNYADAFTARESANVTVKNCVMKDIGVSGINFSECKNALIDGNTIYNTGLHSIRSGYYPYGGYPQMELDNIIPTGTVISNNHCYNSGNNGMGMIASITFEGIGTVIEKNTIHRGINSAIIGVARESKIRYNEIFNMVRETADAGALYSGMSWALYGAEIDHNYIHDLGDREFNAGNLVDAIFWDDTLSGQTARFNILRPNSKTRTYGLISGGGKDQTVTHNIIVDSDQSIGMQDRTYPLKDARVEYNRGIPWAALEEVAKSNTPYLKKYPNILRSYNEINRKGIFSPDYNNVNHNVIVNAAAVNYSNSIKNSPTTKMEGNYVGNDYSIFVDAKKQDFRVKKEAKERLGLDKDILDEDFDINSIGIQRKMIEVDKSFEKIYPRNGDSGLDSSKIQLAWQEAPFADEYDYVIATDTELKNIVKSGTTVYNNVIIEKLEKGTNYYWSVKAKNISRAFAQEWDSTGAPYLFTTATYDVLLKDNLKIAIKKAQEFLPMIAEGDKIGDYKIGTSKALEEAIKEAGFVVNMISGEQATIENAEKAVNNALETARSSKNIGYVGSLGSSDNDRWVTSTPNDLKIEYADNTINISRVNTAGIAATEKNLDDCGIYTFDMKSNTKNGWFAFSIRHNNYVTNDIYWAPGDFNNYFVIVKNDLFELQKCNSSSGGMSMVATMPNNGIFKEDDWNRIEFGAVPAAKGILLLLTVNGQTVFEFLDEINAVRTSGMMAIQPSTKSTVSIRSVPDAKTGEYKLSDSVINDAAKLPIYYTSTNKEYSESGKWQMDSVKGYKNEAVRYTEEKDAYAQFSLIPSTSIKTYKVYYYNVPYDDGDKEAKVHLSNLYVDYIKKLDLTKGEPGWTYLGTFNFANANATGTMDIRFASSGNGRMGVSAVRIEWVDDTEAEFTKIFTQYAKNGLLLKVGNQKAYKDISEYTLDAQPEIYNGRTLIPLRFVSEAFAGEVSWDETSQTVDIKSGNNNVSFTVNDINYKVNGQNMLLEQSPIMVNDRVLVPIRALAEAMGQTVLWDDTRSLILIAEKIEFTDENREQLLDVCDSIYSKSVE